MQRPKVTIDGNEAAAHVAFRTNEVIAIYPITPASTMGELADQWSTRGQPNVWGTVPRVVEMQSEGGAAGTVHGALQAGALTTTFTASQGLLLKIPNMYKIAGELTPTVFHIAARSLAAQALSIFGDHSDVMAARATGFAMLFASSVQEVLDFALISQVATLESRVPFLHVFDGFRTSHEIQKIELLLDDDIRALIPMDAVRAHRTRALSPERPVIRGTAQNPDVFFQARESVNPFYSALPGIVQATMDTFAERIGRRYHLFDYVGAPDADRVIVLMGSGCETAEETVRHLADRGERIGLVKVRLFRPLSASHLLAALPPTVRVLAALDRTKEPGAAGEPLYQDVLAALNERAHGDGAPAVQPLVIGGRYGLSSKEFTPAMIKGIFDEMAKTLPKNHFTVGIHDDVTHSSIDYDPAHVIEQEDVTRAVFWGLGADGTVGANKNSIQIIGEETSHFAQGYFVFDSKKAGARTISHLRFGPRPIQSTYLIQKANFVAVHQFGFLETFDVLKEAEPGAIFLLNAPYATEEVWASLPARIQAEIIAKKLRLYAIDAYRIARDVGLGGRMNTIMQTCFFALSGVLPREEAIQRIKQRIKKTYGKRGEAVVNMNYAAVDAAIAHLHEIEVPERAMPVGEIVPPVPSNAPEFVQNVTGPILAGRGDDLPVSALPVDGTYPTGTTQWEKRNIALQVPVWDPDLCIQCGKCVMVCPHAAIRAKLVRPDDLATAPDGFATLPGSWRELSDRRYTLQVAVEDCTGCELCVEICPAKDKDQPEHRSLNMVDRLPVLEKGRRDWDFFLTLPDLTPADAANPLAYTKVKDVQLLEPLFEFSSACSGCGETPYLRLVSQLFGDRTLIANATGCSSIYGGNLPTTPWTHNRAGRGPAWANSLFEDNAEFGLGMRVALDKQMEYARGLVSTLSGEIGAELAQEILDAPQLDDRQIAAQRERVDQVRGRLRASSHPVAADLLHVADTLVRKDVWIIGGDGWAYDIGYGGLDHVLASGHNVNLLVLDTEVYSNTGGQASKATGLGAVAKFAAGGKATPKKDLGMLAMSYGYVYVAQIAMGANENQTIKALREAESYEGPSLVIAYGHCIAHGIDMKKGMQQQELAALSGYWPLYRFDPRRRALGENPFQLDSKAPKIPLKDYAYNEARYRMLSQSNPDAAAAFLDQAQKAVHERWARYERMAAAPPSGAVGVGERENGKPAAPSPRPTAAVRPAPPAGARPASPPAGVKPAVSGKLPPGAPKR